MKNQFNINYNDIVGLKFGKLLVIEYAGYKETNGTSGKRRSFYLCKCDCGNECYVQRKQLLNGRSVSCANCQKIEIFDDYAVYRCSNNKSFIFDKNDLNIIKLYKWTVDKNGYVRAHIKGTQVQLGRYLLNPEQDKYVDHINGNPTDNRRENLRIVNYLENQRNLKRASNNTSGFKGVSYRKDRNKYRAYITINNRYVHLGNFDTAISAANAYDEKARILFGEYAALNFPNEHEQGCNR